MTLLKQDTVTSLKFSQYNSTRELQMLAKSPFDLTKGLTPERLNSFVAESCGFKLLYGTERITDKVMHALVSLAQESQALNSMERMQTGEPLNYTEGCENNKRPALHTAARDFFGKIRKTQKHALKAKQEVEKLRAFMEKIENENQFTSLIVIAIGGSSLGPCAHYHALKHLQKPGKKVYFISNIDPDDSAEVLRCADLNKSLVLVISKSGTTLETVTNEEVVRRHFINKGLNPKNHFVSISTEGSPLDNPDRYLECFHIWEWIGGRYSTSSMGGGVLLSFAYGIEAYLKFLKGAQAMDLAALSQDIHSNLPLISALLSIWNHNFLNYPTLAVVPYSHALTYYTMHIQQVEMESNGKRIDRHGMPVDFQTCPVVWGGIGTNAQHSFFQMIHQGTSNIPIEFIGFKEPVYGEDIRINGTTSQEKLLSNMFAQALTLACGKEDDNPNKAFPGNIPSHILLGKKLTPFALGALLAYYEHKVAFQGFIWDINSFDQEGVELGKTMANKIMRRFAADSHERNPLADVLIQQVNSL